MKVHWEVRIALIQCSLMILFIGVLSLVSCCISMRNYFCTYLQGWHVHMRWTSPSNTYTVSCFLSVIFYADNQWVVEVVCDLSGFELCNLLVWLQSRNCVTSYQGIIDGHTWQEVGFTQYIVHYNRFIFSNGRLRDVKLSY